MQKNFGIALVTALLATSVAAHAQGIPGGMERGRSAESPAGEQPPVYDILSMKFSKLPLIASQIAPGGLAIFCPIFTKN
jgi:hypothetical protein